MVVTQHQYCAAAESPEQLGAGPSLNVVYLDKCFGKQRLPYADGVWVDMLHHSQMSRVDLKSVAHLATLRQADFGTFDLNASSTARTKTGIGASSSNVAI